MHLIRETLIAVMLLLAIPAFAQDSTSHSHIEFQTSVRELTTYLDANDKRSATVLYKDVLKQMEKYVDATYKAMNKAEGKEKRDLKAKFDRQRMLTEQFKGFQSDILRNRPSIHTWTDQFIKTLY